MRSSGRANPSSADGTSTTTTRVTQHKRRLGLRAVSIAQRKPRDQNSAKVEDPALARRYHRQARETRRSACRALGPGWRKGFVADAGCVTTTAVTSAQ